MVAEVTSNSGPVNQIVQSRMAELQQAQRVRESSTNQLSEGVEVRISQRESQRVQTSENLTYENIRPRNGSAPQEERGNEPQEASQTSRAQAAVMEQAQERAREPRRASEAVNDLT